MQFNSVKSGSFLTGAKSVNDNVTDIYNTAIQTGFNADQVIKQSNANDAVKQMATARRQASMAKAGLSNFTDAKITEMDAKLQKDLKDIYRPAVRMQGVNRMAGSLAAGKYIMDESKLQQKEQAELKDFQKEYRDALIASQESRTARDSKEFELQQLKIEQLKQQLGLSGSSETPAVKPTNSVSTLKPNTTSADQPEITSLNTVANPVSFNLTDEDKKWIAFAVSGEARPNTDDEFGVVSVIKTRMKNRGQTAKEVVFAPGQFAAVVGTPGLHGPTARHEPGLQERLFSPEGLAKIADADRILDGRDYFKGQTMLHNRSNKGNEDYNKDGVPDMDPMFHPLGNFYHRGNQS